MGNRTPANSQSYISILLVYGLINGISFGPTHHFLIVNPAPKSPHTDTKHAYTLKHTKAQMRTRAHT